MTSKPRTFGQSAVKGGKVPKIRIIKTISVVSKTLHKKQKAIEKQYDNLVEAANRLALTVESDHNIIADSHEYIHRNTVYKLKKINFFIGNFKLNQKLAKFF